MTKTKKPKIKKIDATVKVLGASKYAGAKKKKVKKVSTKDPVISKKNSALKVKIKNLRKEIARISASANPDLKEKKVLEDKLKKLTKISDKIKPAKTEQKSEEKVKEKPKEK